ncbi:MAG: L,D-transpeptidase family protein [Pseudomonadota bacterium]
MGDLVVGRTGARFGTRRLPCAIGRSGIRARKREGDGATPAGLVHVVALLFRPDRIGRAALPAWAEPIRPSDGWSDDPDDPAYNRLVRRPHHFSHERLRQGDPLYDLIVITDYNWRDPRPGAGSAIFLHRWRRPRWPTEGCVAFAPDDLLWLAWRLRPGARIVVQVAS